MSTQSFAQLGVSSALVRALSRRGINEPFAIQRLVIADVLAGRDVLAKAPTGSGKTLAFGIPLIAGADTGQRSPSALVLAPTRELACQIVDELGSIAPGNVRITAVYGGVSLQRQARDAGRSQIVVATPGRLEDLLERGSLRLDGIRILVLDEADRMLDMGFRPPVDRIVARCPQERQTLFFSATLDGEAGRVAATYTHQAVRHEHGPSPRRAAAAVEHRFVAVEREHRVEVLVAELGRARDRALVFVRTKRGADRLVKRLRAHGVTAVAMHGDRSQRQREQALASFESGAIDTLVATDVAARGIDVAGISHVINFDPPGDRDAYVHRVGRTGRAGRAGIGITFVGAAERREVGALVRGLGIEHGLDDGGRPARRPGEARSARQRRRPRHTAAKRF